MKERIRETDYTQRERPSTRLKQFFDIAKHRFVELMKVSLLQTVFNVPLMVSFVLFYALVRNAHDINSLMTVSIFIGASFLISLPMVFTGMTGTFYCMKKLAYAEGEFASSTFFLGLKEEWKNGALIGLLAGFSTAIALIGGFFLFIYMHEVDPVIVGFGIAILSIQLIVVLMVCYYSIGQVVCYNNKMRFILKNSFIMTLIRFPINLGIFIIYPGIFIALWAIMEITMFVGIALFIIFVCFGHLMWALNDLAAFDKFINKEQYPDYYRKGLYNSEQAKEV